MITILIPVYNEERNLPALYAELMRIAVSRSVVTGENGLAEVDLSQYDWEFLFVNDGSSDGTLEALMRLRREDRRVNVLNFARNFGKETAMLAGLDFASGDAVVIMDADLQDPVELIPEMVYWWRKGYDDVYGQRTSRGRESWLRKTLSLTYYRMLQSTTRTDVLQNAGDFRLLSRRAVDALTRLRESQRYTKGLFCWIGFNKKAIPFERGSRTEGKSSFNFLRLFNLAIEGFTSYTTSPLRLASILGITVSLMSMIYLVFVLVKYFVHGEDVQGYPTLVCLILFLGGVQLLALGIIGEYIGRIFNETKHRPPYIVESYNGVTPLKPNDK